MSTRTKHNLIKKENLTIADLFQAVNTDGNSKYFSLGVQKLPFLDTSNSNITVYSHQGFKNWGVDNQYGTHLERLYQSSPTHASLINLKSTLTCGDGFSYDQSNTKLTSFIEVNNLDEVFELCTNDLVKYGAFSMLIYWNAGATIGETPQIAKVEHCDFSLTRPEETGDINIDAKYYYYSRNWKDVNSKGNTAVKIPVYDITQASKQSPQLFVWFSKKDGNHCFPVEDYRSALKSIVLEGEIQNFWMNNVMNGLVPSGIFTLTQVPDDEARSQIKQQIKRDFTTTDNAGKYICLFSEGDNKPTFTPISTDNNASIYDSLSQNAVQKIVSAHQLNSPALAGLPSNGSIFTNEISTAFEYFYNTIIKKNYQNPLLRAFNKIFSLNGYNEKVGIKNLNPIQYIFSENVILATLSKDEIRERMGYNALPNGEGSSIGSNGQTININPTQPKNPTPATPPQNQITGR